MNRTKAEIDEWWISTASRLAIDSPTIDHWLEIGEAMGALEDAPMDDIDSRISKRPVSDAALRCLIDAGRTDCLIKREATTVRLIDHYLAHPDSIPPTRIAEGPFYLLPVIISRRYRWFPAAMRGDVNAFHISADVRLRIEGTDAPAEGPAEEFAREALGISKRFLEQIGAARVADSNIIRILDGALEECRRLWGDQPAIVAAASSISYNRRGSRAKSSDVSLFDDQSLSQRFAWARYRKNDVNWWRGQFSMATGVSERRIFHLAFWTSASVHTITELTDLLGSGLDAMPEQEWDQVLSLVATDTDGLYEGPSTSSDLQHEATSIRAALLFALREPRISQSVFMQRFQNLRSGHWAISQFRASQAFKAAMDKVLSWNAALAILREESHVRGAQVYLRHYVRRESLPEPVVKEVLANPDDFPLSMWDIAMSRASILARKAVRPVGQIARKDGWFS